MNTKNALSPLLTAWPPVDPKLVEDPGLDLEALFSLAESGNFEEVARTYEPKLLAGYYDIRLLSIYLHQVVLLGGFASIASVVGVFQRAIGEEIDKLLPDKQREKHVARRLEWWGSTTFHAIDYHRQKTTDLYQGWLTELSEDQVDAGIEAIATFLSEIPQEYSTSAQFFSQLSSVLREVREELEAAADSIDELPPPEKPKSMLPSPPDYDDPPKQASMSINISHRFGELLAKLQAFHTLLEKGRFDKAALVSDDVLRELESFDPREYFPELFVDFSQEVASHVDKLAPFWEERDSLQQRLLRQYFKVDLERFVDE